MDEKDCNLAPPLSDQQADTKEQTESNKLIMSALVFIFFQLKKMKMSCNSLD